MNDKNQWPDIQSRTRSLQKLPKMKKKLFHIVANVFVLKRIKNQPCRLHENVRDHPGRKMLMNFQWEF